MRDTLEEGARVRRVGREECHEYREERAELSQEKEGKRRELKHISISKEYSLSCIPSFFTNDY